MKDIKQSIATILTALAILAPLSSQASSIDLDYFRVFRSSDGQIYLHCGLNDEGIRKMKQEHGWLPKGNVVLFKASDRYQGPVLSYNQPAFLLNRWSIYPNGHNAITFVRADGTGFEINMISARKLGACVVDVDLLDQIIDQL